MPTHEERSQYFGTGFLRNERATLPDFLQQERPANGEAEGWNLRFWEEASPPTRLCLNSPLYGRIPAPESIPEFFAALEFYERNNARTGGIAGWRGMASASWFIVSFACRHVLSHGSLPASPKALEEAICSYERELLASVRHEHLDTAWGRRLSDLELLALLQHHGAPTRLVDFSENALVAAWFAAEREEHDVPGIILGIPRLQLQGAAHPFPFQVMSDGASYDDICGSGGIQAWRPPRFHGRTVSQQSVLAFYSLSELSGVDVIGEGFYRYLMSVSPSEERFEEDLDMFATSLPRIAVSPALKRRLREFLPAIVGLRRTVLFPDLADYCSSLFHPRQDSPPSLKGGMGLPE